MKVSVNATVTETLWKKHTCTQCGLDFAYQITCTGHGTAEVGSRDPLTIFETSARRARLWLRQSFQNTFSLIPCPNCGHYQPEMVAVMRKEAYKTPRLTKCFFTAARLLVCPPFLFPVLWPIIPLVILGVLLMEQPRLTVTLVYGTVVCTPILLVLASFIMDKYAWRRFAFDPYAGQPFEVWIAEARRLGAVTQDELAKLEAIERAVQSQPCGDATPSNGEENPLDFT